MTLGGPQKDAALQTTCVVSIEEEDDYERFDELSFHRKCYSSFTNKTLLNRAEARHKKVESKSKTSLTVVEEGESSLSSEPVPKKVLRSSIQTTSTSASKSEHVLPAICIICKKEDLYCKDTVCFKLH